MTQPGSVAPIVGREREQAILRGCLADMLAGSSQIVLVSGPAGIGKTTLIRALVCEAGEHQALVLRGHCYDYGTTPPYGPWIEVAHTHQPSEGLPPFPETLRGESLPDVGSQETFFDDIRDVVDTLTLTHPLVIVLEDMHWSDPASLDLLRFWSRQVGSRRLLLAITYRSDELTRQHPLFQLLPALVHDAGARRIELRPLQHDAIRAMVTMSYDLSPADERHLTGYLRSYAEGNPFYVRELCEMLEGQGILLPTGAGWTLGNLGRARVPGLIQQVIEKRLARLDERTRELLSIASVIGQEVPIEVLQRASDASDAQLDSAVHEALEERLMEESESFNGLRFTHALIREALYEGIILTRRKTWHRRIAEAMAGLPQPDPDAMANHLQQAGDARAIEWLIRAGERAQRSYALLDAAERFEAAATLMQGDPARDDERGWLLYRVGWVLRHAHGARAIPFFEEAERVARSGGNTELAAYALCDRGFLRCFVGDPRRGIAEMEAGLHEFDSLSGSGISATRKVGVFGPDAGLWGIPSRNDRSNSSGAAAAANLRRGQYILWLGIAGQSRRALEQGEAFLAALGSTPEDSLGESISDAWIGIAYAKAALGQPVAARQAFDRARTWLLERNEWATVATLTLEELDSICLAYQTHDLAERERLASRAEEAYRQARGGTYIEFSRGARLPILILEGKWNEARQVAEDLASVPSATHRYLLHALGTLHRHQGRPQDAWSCVSRALPRWLASEPGDYLFQESLDHFRLAANLALDEGNLVTAREWLEMHSQWLDWGGAIRRRSEDRIDWARYYHLSGDRTRAEQYAARAVEHAQEPRQPLALIAAHRISGEIAAAGGQLGRAEKHLSEALALADACVARFDQALTQLALAELRVAGGDLAEARHLYDEARSALIHMDARPALARANALAARLDVAPQDLPTPGGLSPREIDVLRLLAAGRSNKEVASELGMSVRTAERHIANLYTKIDAAGRAEAIAFAHQHGLT